jgi:hypothetical protein
MYPRLKIVAIGITGLLALVALASVAAVAVAAEAAAFAKPADKYTVKVPGGLEFAEFRGYESWEVISFSLTDRLGAIILGDPAMIRAYKAGIPGNGKSFPDGVRMAKIHWTPAKEKFLQATVAGALKDVDFMVKDSKRFADSGGWGYAAFKFEAANKSFLPVGTDGRPPQGNDAKCGFACHTVAKTQDYVFTEYAAR